MNPIAELVGLMAGICTPVLLTAAVMILGLESALLIGLLLPGAGTVLMVGSLVGLGEISPIAAALILVAATTGGAQIAFTLRRRQIRGNDRLRLGPRLTFRLPTVATRVSARIQRTFDRNAHAATMISHLVGGTRTFGPRMAASSQLSYRMFAVCNAIGAIVWVSTLLAAGSIAGANPAIAPYLIAACIVLVVLGWLLRQIGLR
jgi:membrane-associated protein